MDVGSMPRGLGKASVTSDQRDCERLTQRHKGSVIRGEVMAQVPHPICKRLMRIADDREICEIGSAILGPIVAETPSADEPA